MNPKLKMQTCYIIMQSPSDGTDLPFMVFVDAQEAHNELRHISSLGMVCTYRIVETMLYQER